MKDTIRVYPDQAGQYRWHRRAGNNEIIAQGESHPRMSDAKRAAERANPDTEWDWAPDNGWDRQLESTYRTPPPLTGRQERRLDEWLRDVNTRSEHRVLPHHLAWTVAPETRPGRGHDVQAVYLDGDIFEHLQMDPYGNGDESRGTVDVVHSDSNDDCDCDDCTTEREADL